MARKRKIDIYNELDNERKYKLALERAKKLYEQGTITESLGYVFPELIEDEDERIRKAIKKALQVRCDGSRIISDEPVTLEEAIAWLEKRGENKPTEYIEIKFCEGDKVVSNQDGKVYTVGTAYDITGDNICLHDTDGNHLWTNRDDLNNDYHLWTLKDAKDGDVLYAKGGYFKGYIFKFSSFTEDNVISTHFGYDVFHGIFDTKLSRFGREEDFEFVNPATKKQRELLFQKIKEAGYEWDADKKELKKIESKTLDTDKVIEWLKITINERAENYGVYNETRLILPYNSIEDLINDFKEDFGL